MSQFIKEIKALESDVAQREAQQKAEREQRQQEYKARVRNARIANTLLVARCLGIDVMPDDLTGYSLNNVEVGDWRIQFDVDHQKFEGGNSSESITSISVRAVDSWVASPKEGDDKKYTFGATFTYLPLIENNWNEVHPDDYELYLSASNASDKVRNYNASIKHPLYAPKLENSFTMKFSVIVPHDEELQSITEEQRLDMAKEMLAIENRYNTLEQRLEKWRFESHAMLKRLEEEYQRQEQEKLERQAEYERQQKEYAERVAKRRQEQAAKPRYTFSGNSLGEILEAVYREIVAENQEC